MKITLIFVLNIFLIQCCNLNNFQYSSICPDNYVFDFMQGRCVANVANSVSQNCLYPGRFNPQTLACECPWWAMLRCSENFLFDPNTCQCKDKYLTCVEMKNWLQTSCGCACNCPSSCSCQQTAQSTTILPTTSTTSSVSTTSTTKTTTIVPTTSTTQTLTDTTTVSDTTSTSGSTSTSAIPEACQPIGDITDFYGIKKACLVKEILTHDTAIDRCRSFSNMQRLFSIENSDQFVRLQSFLVQLGVSVGYSMLIDGVYENGAWFTYNRTHLYPGIIPQTNGDVLLLAYSPDGFVTYGSPTNQISWAICESETILIPVTTSTTETTTVTETTTSSTEPTTSTSSSSTVPPELCLPVGNISFPDGGGLMKQACLVQEALTHAEAKARCASFGNMQGLFAIEDDFQYITLKNLMVLAGITVGSYHVDGFKVNGAWYVENQYRFPLYSGATPQGSGDFMFIAKTSSGFDTFAISATQVSFAICEYDYRI